MARIKTRPVFSSGILRVLFATYFSILDGFLRWLS
jgi:hypothetical protein